MVYHLPKFNSFNRTIDEVNTIKIISAEMKRVHPPHYGSSGILICEKHPSESTRGGLIILDTYKSFCKLDGWNIKIYPMLMMSFVVHEELHKTDDQKGVKKLIKFVKNGKLKNNFTDFNKYSSSIDEKYNSIGIHYYVCLYTHLWMKKTYGKKYLDVIGIVWNPYDKFEKYIRNNEEQLLKLMLKIHLAPPDIDNFI
jgi:hypothetical protein